MSDDKKDGGSQASDTYEVGYRKPPKEYQFPKGRSGNPKGRKKQETTIRAIMKKIIAETVTAKLPEGERSMSALEFVLRSSRNRAAKGDNRATDQFINLTMMAFGIGEPDDIKRDISKEDRELLREALKSFGEQSSET